MLVRGTRSKPHACGPIRSPARAARKDSHLLGVRALRDRMVFWLPRLSARPTPAGDQSRRLACLLLAVGRGRHAVSARKERGDRHGLCPRPARPPVLGPGTTSSARAPLPGATLRTCLASARSHGLGASQAGAQDAPWLGHAPASALRLPRPLPSGPRALFGRPRRRSALVRSVYRPGLSVAAASSTLTRCAGRVRDDQPTPARSPAR